MTENVANLFKGLLAKSIDTGKNIMRESSKMYFPGGDYPSTKEAFRNSLLIPLYSEPKEENIRYIATILNQELS